MQQSWRVRDIKIDEIQCVKFHKRKVCAMRWSKQGMVQPTKGEMQGKEENAFYRMRDLSLERQGSLGGKDRGYQEGKKNILGKIL